jgi:hypothetical protein
MARNWLLARRPQAEHDSRADQSHDGGIKASPYGPGQSDPEGQDWLILTSPAGGAVLAFQKVGELPEATWPDGPVPQQFHLDTTVPTMGDLDVAHERALALGARLLQDRSDDPQEPVRVFQQRGR